ncbi:MAG: sigma 54-interacting transcriptional regulator [Bacillota bacterium]
MSVIRIDESKCKKCYACIRECPVKATKVEDGRMQVVDNMCIACGECLETCAVGARYAEDAIQTVDSLLRHGGAIAVLDPSFAAAFHEVVPGQVVAGLSALGFSEVRDTSHATALVINTYRAMYSQLAEARSEQAAHNTDSGRGQRPDVAGAADATANGPACEPGDDRDALPEWGAFPAAPGDGAAVAPPAPPMISSVCPAVVGLIERHYPDLVGNLLPVVSPPIVAAQLIREAKSGDAKDMKVVYIGPCVSRKAEAAELGARAGLDAVLTFDELRAMFESQDIILRDLAPRALDGPVVPLLRQSVFAGGVSWLMGISKGPSDDELVIAAGGSRCMEVMDDLARGALTPLFVDAMMCRGCIDAPSLRKRSPISVRKRIAKVFAAPAGMSPVRAQGSDAGQGHGEAVGAGAGAGAGVAEIEIAAAAHDLPPASLLQRTFKAKGAKLPIPSEAEIAEILAFSGRLTPEDHLDCGMCGYPTCRALAIAVYQNMARSDMCVHYLMNRLKEKLELMKNELVIVKSSSFDDIYGSSKQILTAKDLAERASKTGSTVLLLGESGTGKEVFARAIHAASSRRDGPFVSVNCAAIPDTLMESELFGYDEGAFTGATKGGKPGKFELATKGTIFLDEVGDMSLPLQAKLLRVLQSHKIERVGGTREIDVDVRVIAATNRDLKAMVDRGEFRLDLYYRLNVVSIRVPPLRERLEDIPIIISRSLAKPSARCPTNVTSVSPEALRLMLDYDWPGNVRELENVLERALNLADGEVIEVAHLPEHIVKAARRERRAVLPGEALDDVVSRAEQEALLDALKSTNNNRTLAARKLGISRSAFYEKLKKYNIV